MEDRVLEIGGGHGSAPLAPSYIWPNLRQVYNRQTKPEIYAQVGPTLSMYIGLSDQSLAIAGALCSALGLQPQAVPTRPVVQLEKIVLAELPGWRLRPRLP